MEYQPQQQEQQAMGFLQEQQQQQQQQRPKKPVQARDFVLMGSSMHLLCDFLGTWGSFGGSSRSLHAWLLTSYLILVASLWIIMAMKFGDGSSAADVMLNLRQKSAMVRALVSAMWCIMTPLLIVWSISGTWLTWQVMMNSPESLPSGLHLCFLLSWQVVSFAWVVAYSYAGLLAWRLESRRRRAESDLRAVQDDDSVQRWGRLDGSSTTFLPFASEAGAAHLSAAQIRSLPGVHTLACGDAKEGQDCPICLMPFGEGDIVRQLSKCRHAFHRSCVDLWLLRAAECPMCKTRVEAEPSAIGLGEDRHSPSSEGFAVR